MSKLKVAVIGTGIMGTGVGLTLRAKGHDVTCWNRTKANAEELLRAGAVWKETPRAAAEGADFVVLLVWNEGALRAVTSGPDGLWAAAKAGQVYVDMSTQLPETAVAEAREFEKRGAAFLDAPVHGTKGEARSGGLWIMVGGERKVYDRALPLFQVIGATVHYMGPTGRGCAAKLCGNHFVSAILASMERRSRWPRRPASTDSSCSSSGASRTSARPSSTGRGTPCSATSSTCPST